MADLPSAEVEIEAFLREFENGTLPKERWTHAAHVLTGACYVYALSEVAATERMRDRVQSYNLAIGGQNTATSGYHETITIFWIKVLAELRAELLELEREAFVAAALERYGSARGLLAEFYELDVVKSEQARREWIPPTRRSFHETPTRSGRSMMRR